MRLYCNTCKGKGKTRKNETTVPCPSCTDGTIEVPDAKYCPACGGRGTRQPGISRTKGAMGMNACRTCGGRGWITGDAPKVAKPNRLHEDAMPGVPWSEIDE